MKSARKLLKRQHHRTIHLILKGDSFICRVFRVKIFFFRLCDGLGFERYLVVAKHQATKYNAAMNNIINGNAITTEINIKLDSFDSSVLFLSAYANKSLHFNMIFRLIW